MVMMITAPLEYEGLHFDVHKLSTDLREFHEQHPFATGLDWSRQEFWATMSNEQAFAFVLKHPEHADRFREIT